MTLEAGTVLNDIYRVVKLLGKGSMGNVYLVERIEDDKKFVVKELTFSKDAILNYDDGLEIFRREAEFMAKFDHPGIPKMYGVFSQNGKEYLTMDYIEGKTLEEIINSSWKAIEKNKAITWTIEIAEIIDYLHNSFQKPLVYRDLKPSNIIIKPDGKPVLVDFGIARYYNPDKTSDTFNYGTPGYAAPEQYKGKGQSTPQSDIFGLGVILFQMLTKYDPSLKPLQFPSMKSLNPLISDELESTVFKAIQLDPLKRYISMAEFKEVLQKYNITNYGEGEKGKSPGKAAKTYENRTGISALAERAERFIKVPATIMGFSAFLLLFLAILVPYPVEKDPVVYVQIFMLATLILSLVSLSALSFFVSMAEIISAGKKDAFVSENSIYFSGWNRPCIIIKMITIILFWSYIVALYNMFFIPWPARKNLETAWIIIFFLIIFFTVIWFILIAKRKDDISQTGRSPSIRTVRFSDTEMAVTIIIFTLLSYIIVPNFLKARASGHLCYCESQIKDLATAMEVYATENNGLYPEGFYKLLEISKNKSPYMSKIPDCKKSNLSHNRKNLTSYKYIRSEDCKNFTMWCIQNHLDCGMEEGYPQYNPYQGLIIR